MDLSLILYESANLQEKTFDSIFGKIDRFNKLSYVRKRLNEKYINPSTFDVKFSLEEQQMVYYMVNNITDSLLENYLGSKYYNFYQNQLIEGLHIFKNLKQSAKNALNKTINFINDSGERISASFNMFIKFIQKIIEKGVKTVKELISLFFELIVKTKLNIQEFLSKIGVFEALEDVDITEDELKIEKPNSDILQATNKVFKTKGEQKFFLYLMDFIQNTQKDKQAVSELNESSLKDIIWSQSTGGPTWWIKIKRFIGRYTFGIRTKADVGNIGKKQLIKRALIGICVSCIGGLLISSTLVYAGAATWVYILVMIIWHSRSMVSCLTTRYVTKNRNDAFFPKFPNVKEFRVLKTITSSDGKKKRKVLYVPQTDKASLAFWVSFTLSILSIGTSAAIQAIPEFRNAVLSAYRFILKPLGYLNLSKVPLIGPWLSALQDNSHELNSTVNDIKNIDNQLNSGQDSIAVDENYLDGSNNDSGTTAMLDFNKTNSGFALDNEQLFPSDGSNSAFLGDDTKLVKDYTLKLKEAPIGTQKGTYQRIYDWIGSNKIQSPDFLYYSIDSRQPGLQIPWTRLNAKKMAEAIYKCIVNRWIEHGGSMESLPPSIRNGNIQLGLGNMGNDDVYEISGSAHHQGGVIKTLMITTKDGDPLNYACKDGTPLHDALLQDVKNIVIENTPGGVVSRKEFNVTDLINGTIPTPEETVEDAVSIEPIIITPNISFLKFPGNLGVILSSKPSDRLFQISKIDYIDLQELLGNENDENSLSHMINLHNEAVKQYKAAQKERYNRYTKTIKIYENQLKNHSQLSQNDIQTVNSTEDDVYDTKKERWNEDKIKTIKGYIKSIKNGQWKLNKLNQKYQEVQSKVLAFYTDDFYYIFKDRGYNNLEKYKDQVLFFIDPQTGRCQDVALYYKKRRQNPYYVKGLYAHLTFQCDDKQKLAKVLNLIGDTTLNGLREVNDAALHQQVFDYEQQKDKQVKVSIKPSYSGNTSENNPSLGNFSIDEFKDLINKDKKMTDFYSGQYADKTLLNKGAQNLTIKPKENNAAAFIENQIVPILEKLKNQILTDSRFAHIRKYIFDKNNNVIVSNVNVLAPYFMRYNSYDDLSKQEYDQKLKETLKTIEENSGENIYQNNEDVVASTELKNLIELIMQQYKNVYSTQGGLGSKSWIKRQEKKNDVGTLTGD